MGDAARGNYCCITKDGIRTAQEAVHTNIEESRSVYNFVFDLCVKLNANPARFPSKPAAAGLSSASAARSTASQHPSAPTSWYG
jgi:hypothetical protein